MHEYLRNYGGLGEDEKPLVVSAILLALREQKYGFRLDMLYRAIQTVKSCTDTLKTISNGQRFHPT